MPVIPESRLYKKTVMLEKQILGCMIFDPTIIGDVASKIDSNCFWTDSINRKVYSKLLELNGSGQVLDLSIINLAILDCGGDVPLTYALDLSEGITTTANVYHFCEQLKDCFLSKSVLELYDKSVKELEDESVTASVIIDRLNNRIGSVDKPEINVFSGESLVGRRVSGLIERRKTKTVSLGFSAIDRKLTVGLTPPGLSIIAGRPSMGKSTLKTNIIRNLCEDGFGVVSFALEQSFDIEMDRLNSLMTGIPLLDILRCRYWQDEDERKDKINESTRKIAEDWLFTLVANKSMSLEDMTYVVKKVKKSNRVDVIFIDLFDVVTDVDVITNKAQAISVALTKVAKLSEMLNVHVCLLVQIKRFGGRSRVADDYVPTLEHLKESGAYEERADLVLLLFREGYYDKEIQDNVLSVIIAKQRNGIANVTVDMIFDKSILQLGDLEGAVDEECEEAKKPW